MKKEEKKIEESDAQTVGELLRNTRLKQGKTLGDVSKELCIRKVYLEAIESLDYESLPPVPYGMGFVRSYAEYLGLNSQRIVQSYKKAAQPDKAEDENAKAAPEKEADFSAPNMKHIALGIGGLVVLIGVWSMISKYQAPEENEEIAVMETETTVPSPVILEENEDSEENAELSEMGVEDVAENTSVEDASATTEKTETTSITENLPAEQTMIQAKEPTVEKTAEKTVPQTAVTTPAPAEKAAQPKTGAVTATRIRMVLIGPSWLEVKQGGTVLLSGIYNKGFAYDIPDGENTIVSVGRYYNVDFYIDGRLTKVASSLKQMNINLDKFLEKAN